MAQNLFCALNLFSTCLGFFFLLLFPLFFSSFFLLLFLGVGVVEGGVVGDGEVGPADMCSPTCKKLPTHTKDNVGL